MTFPGCTFTRSTTATECTVCGLALGASGPSDCPRIREPYGVTAPVAMPIVRSTGAAGVAVRHVDGEAA